MNVKRLLEMVPRITGDIKAQVAEEMQLTESGPVSLYTNVLGKQTINISQGVSLEKIKDLLEKHEEKVMNNVKESLQANKAKIERLPKDKQLQFLADSTASSIASNLSTFSLPPSKAPLPDSLSEGETASTVSVLTFPSTYQDPDEGETM